VTNKFKINPKYLILLVVLMIGLSFASVPLYDLFCRVTGFGGTTQKAENSPNKILNKTIKVRFDSNVSSNLNFNFKSMKNYSDIKIGEVNNIKFRVTNEGKKPENVVSTFNTSPPSAGIHFKKIACFCFEKQTINPRETREFTVAYYIDPKIVEDPATKGISEITLSYTLFKVDKLYKRKNS
jgi:cytochrome c oxidase assembly protein subunit 11|tara:strand:+ start:77 stop:622 length:546 start_codon:yes stop_codon:yes gene_type:complete